MDPPGHGLADRNLIGALGRHETSLLRVRRVVEAGRATTMCSEPPLSPQITAVLDASPPPVSVGVGCIGAQDGEQLAADVAAALRRVGCRGLLLGFPPVDGPDMLSVPGAPHGHLFPRVATTVHHGGAGTVVAGLNAGAAALAVPRGLDQPFWAARIQGVGVSVGLPRKRLRTETFRAALKAVLESDIQGHAAALGTRRRAENDAAQAADLILG